MLLHITNLNSQLKTHGIQFLYIHSLFCGRTGAAQPALIMEGEKNKPAGSQLHFLCCLESAFHFAALAFYGRRFFCRQGFVYPGKPA